VDSEGHIDLSASSWRSLDDQCSLALRGLRGCQEEPKAAIVTNSLVVLCSNPETQPVANKGSSHQ
jgi:hypothetical protein